MTTATQRPWLHSLFCALLTGAAITIARPYAEMGFIDDFAYIKVAQVYAQTYHLTYNGWETAMLGWLIPWAALFIKLLGFSFTAVRLSMLPIAMASTGLFHAALRRFGIRPANAIIGALTLGLSPLFVPLAASFMSDVAGLFIVVLTLYLFQRAVTAGNPTSALLWLTTATLANLIGGTVRQIDWLGALVMLPCAAWLLRRHRGILVAAPILWLLSCAAIFLCMHWFARQPYTLGEKLYQGPVGLPQLAHLGAELLKSILCLTLTLLPVNAAWLTRSSRLPRASLLRIAAILLALGLCAIVLSRHGTLEHRIAPWIGHILGTQSIFPSTGEMLGPRPTTLGPTARILLSFATIASLLALIEWALHRKPSPSIPTNTRWREALWLLLPFSLAYLLFLVPRATYSFLYDRYLLGLMPGPIALLLLAHQRFIAPRLPALSTLTLAVFALYTTAATHDWFALNRARIAAVAQVQATGVPLTFIQGGFDFDGWTQLQAAGYINDDRIHNPPNAYQPFPEALTLPSDCRLNFAPFTPSIHPRYFIVFSPMTCLDPSRFASITYSTWLPPLRRTIYVQQRALSRLSTSVPEREEK